MTNSNLDKGYLEFAESVAGKSHAVRLKVGAIIVSGENIVSCACNRTSKGYPDACEYAMNSEGITFWPSTESQSKAFKDMGCNLITNDYVLHAEAGALMNLVRDGVSAKGTTMYVTDEPCPACARLIVASGVKRVVYRRPFRLHTGLDILEKGGVETEQISDLTYDD